MPESKPMIAVFIIAHAPLAGALRSVAMHVYPELAHTIEAYDVPAGSELDRYIREAETCLAARHGQPTLILTDVLGATPANIAGQLARRPGRRALAGLNLPMLWRALNYGHLSLDEVFSRARDGALGGVQPVNTPSPQNQPGRPAPDDPQLPHHQ